MPNLGVQVELLQEFQESVDLEHIDQDKVLLEICVERVEWHSLYKLGENGTERSIFDKEDMP